MQENEKERRHRTILHCHRQQAQQGRAPQNLLTAIAGPQEKGAFYRYPLAPGQV